jgi:hypothetical protein
VLKDFNVEVPRLPGQADDFGECEKFDVQVPADLDQFGRDNSHGTVVGGKGLVQLCHHPAYGRAFFQKVDIVPGIGQVQGGLHPGDAAPHDQNGSIHPVRHKLSPLLRKRLLGRPSSRQSGPQCNYIVATFQL